MNRSDLARIRERHGIRRGQRPTPAQEKALREDIASHLTESEVQDAPRIFGDSGARPMTLKDAVDSLMEEI